MFKDLEIMDKINKKAILPPKNSGKKLI